jgi:c-di-GMP-binding flagellar brake protein YcgR
MSPAEQAMLHDAIARNAGAVLSLPSAGMFRHHRTRLLLAQEQDGFWVECPPGEQPLVSAIIGSGQPVGLSLKASVNKVVFATAATQFRPTMQINKDMVVDALLLAWPAAIKSVQRRAVYRVGVPKDAEITVEVWRIPEHHYLTDRPLASAKLDVSMRDLGVGGMGVICALKADTPKPTTDQRLRIQLTHPNGELIVEGRVRYLRPLPNGNVTIGIQFKKLEEGLDGRKAMADLTNIVGQLQRTEIRRHRLTAPKVA